MWRVRQELPLQGVTQGPPARAQWPGPGGPAATPGATRKRLGLGWGAGRNGLELGRLGFLRTNPPAPPFSAHLPALSSPPAGNRHRNCTPDRVFQGVDLGTPVLSNSSGQSSSSHRVDPVAREGPRGTARQQESLGHTSDTPLATGVTDSDQGKRPESLQPLLRKGNMIHPEGEETS